MPFLSFKFLYISRFNLFILLRTLDMQKKLLQAQSLSKIAASTRALNSSVKAAKVPVDSEKEPI
jgi:hypothetical protein